MSSVSSVIRVDDTTKNTLKIESKKRGITMVQLIRDMLKGLKDV